MPRIYQSIEQAQQLVEANVLVLREIAAVAAEAQDDEDSVNADQAATFLEGAALLIREGLDRYKQVMDDKKESKL